MILSELIQCIIQSIIVNILSYSQYVEIIPNPNKVKKYQYFSISLNSKGEGVQIQTFRM